MTQINPRALASLIAVLALTWSQVAVADPASAERPRQPVEEQASDGASPDHEASSDEAPAPAEADGDDPTTDEEQSPSPTPEENEPPPELPADPQARLELAREAFNRTDYALLVPLLQPMDANDDLLPSVPDKVASRELLGVGYFFLAQQTTDSASRTQMMTSAREVFLRLLRARPEHTLDQLLFPASVVELFEDVRRENAAELDEILRSRNQGATDADLQTVYIERAAVRGVFWLNFLPFGIGQFQNEQFAKGTAFALLEGAALTFNIASYWSIVQLQNESGRFEGTAGDQNSPFANALRARRNLYIGLGAFAALWVLQVVDGIVNFEPESVRIRTLDAPPPELIGRDGDAGLGARLPIGLSVQVDW